MTQHAAAVLALDLGYEMPLAKSCHDIDILTHLVGRNCTRVSSSDTLIAEIMRDGPSRFGGQSLSAVLAAIKRIYHGDTETRRRQEMELQIDTRWCKPL